MSSVRKNIISYKYLDAHSITASFTGSWINLINLDQVSIMMSVICTANNGQFYIDVSNDPTLVLGVASPVVYDTIVYNPGIPPLSSANAIITAVTQLNSFSLVRVRFVQGSTHTDGTVTAYVTAKGV